MISYRNTFFLNVFQNLGREGRDNLMRLSTISDLYFVFSGCIHERMGKLPYHDILKICNTRACVRAQLQYYRFVFISLFQHPQREWKNLHGKAEQAVVPSNDLCRLHQCTCRCKQVPLEGLSRISQSYRNTAGAKHKGKLCCRLKVKTVSLCAKYLGNKLSKHLNWFCFSNLFIHFRIG